MNDVNGHTRTSGLIGNPVEHTLSPLIHNTLSKITGTNMVYVPFLVEEGKLEDAVKGLDALNMLGCNVTVPYKNQVIPYLKDIDELAAKIGAVNTLVKTKDGYKGYNTDMTGLLRAMKSDNVSIEGEEIVILGAGGVGRATAFMCASYNAKKVYLLNRTFDTAVRVADEVNKALNTDKVIPMALSDYDKLPEEKYVTIQSTSIGLAPKVDEVVIEDKNFYNKVKVGYDLIYNPWDTKFMKLVRESGADAYNGLKMLLFQGIDAYEMWNNCKISDEAAEHIYKLMKEALGV